MRAFAPRAQLVGALLVFSALSCTCTVTATHAEEPNDTFAQSTVLDPGTLSLSDDLFPGMGSAPDTLLGVFNEGGFDPFENWIAANDDGSTFGNGEASGLTNVSVNPDGSIRFIVTGSGDLFYDGDHEENGGYKAFVEIFDAADVSMDEFSVTGTLQAGMADQHAFSDAAWLGGKYSINLDNTIDGFTGGDVDFFTYTGLNPGAMFSAETSSVGNIDTILGWYDDTGTLIDQDDDSGVGVWSLIAGTVPGSGQLTFAVTGSGDDLFSGEHAQQEVFDLQLTVEGAGLLADFDGDGDVDLADLTHPTLGWEVRYGNDLGGKDYLIWQREFAGGGGLISASIVPEPGGLALMLAVFAIASIRSNRGGLQFPGQ